MHVELIKNKNRAIRRASRIRRPLSHEDTGSLEYTIGFYEKVGPGAEDGSPELPEKVLRNANFPEARKDTMSDIEAGVVITPPMPHWPTGILSMQVRQGPALHEWRHAYHAACRYTKFANLVSTRTDCLSRDVLVATRRREGQRTMTKRSRKATISLRHMQLCMLGYALCTCEILTILHRLLNDEPVRYT